MIKKKRGKKRKEGKKENDKKNEQTKNIGEKNCQPRAHASSRASLLLNGVIKCISTWQAKNIFEFGLEIDIFDRRMREK